MSNLQSDFTDEINKLLENFGNYLTELRENDPSTVEHYTYDARMYLKQRQTHPLTSLADLYTPEYFIDFVRSLRKRKLNDATIKRRLIGATRFWKYLYKQAINTHPPMSLDDMDINVHKSVNPTRPLTPINFYTVRKEVLDGLQLIY